MSGPSGAGKGTVLAEVFRKRERLRFSVSATTRPPRVGEEDGVHYHFLREDEFLAMVSRGEFLEWVKVHDAYYGTPFASVDRFLDEGIDVILDIDVQGGLKVMQTRRDSIFVFLAPPSLGELRSRLENRNTEDSEKIRKRIEVARWEMSQIEKYDYLVVNDDVEEAAREILAVMAAEHARTGRRQAAIATIRESFEE
jgi:guanylate kinase